MFRRLRPEVCGLWLRSPGPPRCHGAVQVPRAASCAPAMHIVISRNDPRFFLFLQFIFILSSCAIFDAVLKDSVQLFTKGDILEHIRSQSLINNLQPLLSYPLSWNRSHPSWTWTSRTSWTLTKCKDLWTFKDEAYMVGVVQPKAPF